MNHMFSPLLCRPRADSLADEWDSALNLQCTSQHTVPPASAGSKSASSSFTGVAQTVAGESSLAHSQTVRHPNAAAAACRPMVDGDPLTAHLGPTLSDTMESGKDADAIVVAPFLVIGDGSESGGSSRSSFAAVHSCGTLGLVVEDVLYVASYRDVCDVTNIAAANIKAYLCVARDVVPALPPHVTPEQLASGEVSFLHLPLDDRATTELTQHFKAVFEFIDAQERAGRPVALYCQQGKSRSVSFAIAYLMHREGLNAEEALMEIRLGYSRADPNVFFIAQLSAWYETLHCDVTAS